MKNFKKACRQWADTNLTEAFTLYPVDIDKVTDEKFLKEYSGADCTVLLDEKAINSYNQSVYEATDWSDGEIDEDFRDEVLSSLLRPSYGYLVFTRGCRWDGASGYKLVKNVEEAFSRSYEASISPVSVSTGGKTLVCCESSHDVPTGSETIVVALTEKEYDRLDYYADFEEVARFAKNHAEKVA